MSKAVRRHVGATPVRINGRRRIPSVSANRIGSLRIVAESGGLDKCLETAIGDLFAKIEKETEAMVSFSCLER